MSTPPAAPHPSCTVERVGPENAAAVGDLLVGAYARAGYFARWGEDPADPASYAGELRDVLGRAADSVVLVALEERRAVGTMTLAFHGSPVAETAWEGEAELRMLAVDPRARGRGIAYALLDASIEEARAGGARGLVLVSVEPLEAVERRYASRGFVRVPERDERWEYDNGVAEVYPVWRLDLTV